MPPRSDPLPVPDAHARAHSERVSAAIHAAIAKHGGWIPFSTYMHIVLYAPGLGYYVAGSRKFGAAGDFVTAPELTSLFGRTLAAPVAQILATTARRDVVELGAGTGRLARDLLGELRRHGDAPGRYMIVEVSPELRERQRATLATELPELFDRVEWRDDLPTGIDGVVILNEVLDAIPAHVVVRRHGDWFERGVVSAPAGFACDDRALPGPLRSLAETRLPPVVDYLSEINPAAEALIETVGRRLSGGAMLAIDYGFPRHELYHPQRCNGTLMGHYRHRSHADPFLWPGLSDLTTHVDFTAMAEAGERAGLAVAGFATQSAFLVGAGLLELLAAVGVPESVDYIREAAAVQRLVSPAEMGELFKVLALASDPALDLAAFSLADQSHRL